MSDEEVRQENGALILRRSVDGGYPGIAIYPGDEMHNEARALDVLGKGITIRLIDVTTSERSGEGIAHIAICASESLDIEREENVTHARVNRAAGDQAQEERGGRVPQTKSPLEMARWLEGTREVLCEVESSIRDLKEESRRARATGAHHRGNNGYLEYCLIQQAINRRKGSAASLREKIRSGVEQLKILNVERSEDGAKNFHRLFYETAREELAESTIDKLVKKAEQRQVTTSDGGEECSLSGGLGGASTTARTP